MAKPVIPDSMKAYYDQWHFSPAVIDGDHLRCSGMIGLDDSGKAIADPKAQFERAFENVKTILEAAGASLSDVVEMTTFHVGLQQHMAAFMQAKDRFIAEPYPAWTAIGTPELAVPGGLCEIRVTARLPK